jgi:hypothetical protein
LFSLQLITAGGSGGYGGGGVLASSPEKTINGPSDLDPKILDKA